MACLWFYVLLRSFVGPFSLLWLNLPKGINSSIPGLESWNYWGKKNWNKNFQEEDFKNKLKSAKLVSMDVCTRHTLLNHEIETNKFRPVYILKLALN